MMRDFTFLGYFFRICTILEWVIFCILVSLIFCKMSFFWRFLYRGLFRICFIFWSYILFVIVNSKFIFFFIMLIVSIFGFWIFSTFGVFSVSFGWLEEFGFSWMLVDRVKFGRDFMFFVDVLCWSVILRVFWK